MIQTCVHGFSDRHRSGQHGRSNPGCELLAESAGYQSKWKVVDWLVANRHRKTDNQSRYERRPELVTIETAWRARKEQHPGALQKHEYRELDIPDNPDAEPP